MIKDYKGMTRTYTVSNEDSDLEKNQVSISVSITKTGKFKYRKIMGVLDFVDFINTDRCLIHEEEYNRTKTLF